MEFDGDHCEFGDRDTSAQASEDALAHFAAAVWGAGLDKALAQRTQSNTAKDEPCESADLTAKATPSSFTLPLAIILPLVPPVVAAGLAFASQRSPERRLV